MRRGFGRSAMAAFILGSLFLGACSVPFESFPRAQPTTPRARFLVEDRLLRLRETVPGGWGAVETVPVGRDLWLLLDPDPSAPVIHYVTSKLDVVSKPSTGYYDADLHQATYTLTVRVEGGGPERELRTEGSGRSGLSSPVAAFTAVDEAIAKLYQQLAASP